jgi:hypothetical protein
MSLASTSMSSPLPASPTLLVPPPLGGDMGDACQLQMVAGVPHSWENVRAVVMHVVFAFACTLPPSLASLEAACDIDKSGDFSSSELLCAMSAVTSRSVDMSVLERLVVGCA